MEAFWVFKAYEITHSKKNAEKVFALVFRDCHGQEENHIWTILFCIIKQIARKNSEE